MNVLDQNPSDVLSRLTAKQSEVLDLLLQHKTTKQIARELKIAPNTVDARIAVVREKWGTADRKATARVYAHLLETCEKTPCGFSSLETDPLHGQELFRELPGSPEFTVADAQVYERWAVAPEERTVLEAFDIRFGKAGRVGAVLGLAMILAITLAAVLAIAETMSRIV